MKNYNMFTVAGAEQARLCWDDGRGRPVGRAHADFTNSVSFSVLP